MPNLSAVEEKGAVFPADEMRPPSVAATLTPCRRPLKNSFASSSIMDR